MLGRLLCRLGWHRMALQGDSTTIRDVCGRCGYVGWYAPRAIVKR